MKLTRKEYTSEDEKKKDFRLGLIGWYVGNILLCLFQFGVGALVTAWSGSFTPEDGGVYALANVAAWILTLLPWVVNLGLLIYFALTRSQIALGMAVGFASAIVLVIIAGVVLTVACFVMMGNYQ